VLFFSAAPPLPGTNRLPREQRRNRSDVTSPARQPSRPSGGLSVGQGSAATAVGRDGGGVSRALRSVERTAVGESAVTSAQQLITGKQIKNRSVTGVDIKSNSLTSGAIKNQSLRRADFKLGELPAGPVGAKGDVGPQGAQGPKGDKGDPGANGSPDSPQQVLAKLEQVDGSGSGLDADAVDGTDATVLLQDAGIVVLGVGAGPPQFVGATTAGLDVPTSIPPNSCADRSSFGIAGLQAADRLIVKRQSPPANGILESFRITTIPSPQVTYAVCNTTDAPIDPPQTNFRVVALR
jgi:hypothetical protein